MKNRKEQSKKKPFEKKKQSGRKELINQYRIIKNCENYVNDYGSNMKLKLIFEINQWYSNDK